MKLKPDLSLREIDRIVEMAWEDRTPFDLIQKQFDLQEKDVIKIMRSELKESSFRLWRKRVQNRKTKHLKKRTFSIGSFKCTRQKQISRNKVSKR